MITLMHDHFLYFFQSCGLTLTFSDQGKKMKPFFILCKKPNVILQCEEGFLVIRLSVNCESQRRINVRPIPKIYHSFELQGGHAPVPSATEPAGGERKSSFCLI